MYIIQFPFTYTIYIPQLMLFLSDFTCLLRNRNTSFFASVDASTLAQYIFHVYLFVNPKRELEFKIVVSVALQDMILTLETSYVFI